MFINRLLLLLLPRAKTKGRGRGNRQEEDEDAELLRDEDDGGLNAGHRVQVQPSILTGGTLREYQMQGLNWLIHLYDNGINGILADEMVRWGAASRCCGPCTGIQCSWWKHLGFAQQAATLLATRGA